MVLEPAQREAYGRDGFLVLRGLFDPGRASEVAARLTALAQGTAPLPAGTECMEEPAVARVAAPVAAEHRVRKLEGLTLATDPVVRTVAHDPRLVAVMQDLLGPDLKLLRAAAMLKPPMIGSAKGLHQDAAYYPITPMEHIAAWIALDPATTGNGCMEVLPGAHKRGLKAHETRAYESDVVIAGSGAEEGLIALPMAPGDVLLTHCLTPHRSAPNTSSAPRRALILAYMDAKSRYTLPKAQRRSWVASLPITGRSYPGCV